MTDLWQVLYACDRGWVNPFRKFTGPNARALGRGLESRYIERPSMS